ncbi:WD40-repeat-containing domain protein [Pavlovales sp. CCMP2436]|nr:WD40-repeat-containing domain protein [Pavlovales sp. CCMP2436]
MVKIAQGLAQADAHDGGIWAACWVRGGRLLTGGSVDEQVKLWTVGVDALSSGGSPLVPSHSLGVISLSASADGSTCASSGLDGQINLWSVTDEGCEHTRAIDVGPGEGWKAALHPRGELVANGTQHGSVQVWNARTGERSGSLHTPNKKFVLAVAFSPDGDHLAGAAMDGVVSVFDVGSGKSIHELGGFGSMPVRALAFSADSSLLGVGADDASFSLVDMRTGTVAHSFTAHAGWVLSAAFSPTDGVLATSSTDRQVKLWDMGTQKCIHAFSGVHTDNVWQVAFDQSGDSLASVGEDRCVQVYNVSRA